MIALRPTLVTPGNGGIRTDIFYPAAETGRRTDRNQSRGFRTYVRNDVFFQAIPTVLAKRPDAKFLCVAMAGEPQALKWVQRAGH